MSSEEWRMKENWTKEERGVDDREGMLEMSDGEDLSCGGKSEMLKGCSWKRRKMSARDLSG